MKEAPGGRQKEEEEEGKMEHVWKFGVAPADKRQPRPPREEAVSPAETLSRMESWEV